VSRVPELNLVHPCKRKKVCNTHSTNWRLTCKFAEDDLWSSEESPRVNPKAGEEEDEEEYFDLGGISLFSMYSDLTFVQMLPEAKTMNKKRTMTTIPTTRTRIAQ